MRRAVFIFLLIVISVSCLSNGSDRFRIVCYFNSSAQGRTEHKFTVDDIDSTSCTHLVFHYAKLDLYTQEARYSHYGRDIKNKGYSNFTSLKNRNSQLKVMISFKEPRNTNDDTYTNLIENKTNMNALVIFIKDFLDQYKFDGLVLDFIQWTSVKVKFIETLRNTFSKDKFVLSAGSRHKTNDLSKDDVNCLSQNLDFLNLHNYEYRSSNNDTTNHPTSSSGKTWRENVNLTVSPWTVKGFPADRIVVDIPTFGINQTLSSNQTKPLAPNETNATSATFDICELIRNKNFQKFQDTNQTMGTYAIAPRPPSDRKKSRYVNSTMVIDILKLLGGAIIWDSSMDDLRNMCGKNYSQTLKASPSTTAGNSNPQPVIDTDPQTLIPRHKKSFPEEPKTGEKKVEIIFIGVIVFALPLVFLCFFLILLLRLLFEIFGGDL